MPMDINDEINQLKAEIIRLNDKLYTMRGLLCEWNCTSDVVWEHWKLKNVGEKREDYIDFIDEDDNYGPDMPLFDFGNG